MEQNKLPDDLQMMMDASVKFCADHHSDLSPHIAVRAAVKTWAEKYAALRAKADRMLNLLDIATSMRVEPWQAEARALADEWRASRKALEQEGEKEIENGY